MRASVYGVSVALTKNPTDMPLIDLIEFLDPHCWRLPANRRQRLALPSKQGIEADADETASGR